MFRYKISLLIVIATLFFGSSLYAQEEVAPQPQVVKKNTKRKIYDPDLDVIGISYWNWAERMEITQGGTTNKAPSNFAGFGLRYDRLLTTAVSGFKTGIVLISGQATGGQKAGQIIYLSSYNNFVGTAIDFSYFVKLQNRIYIDLGPSVLYRKIQWPKQEGIEAKSGADVNLGLTIQMRARLTKNLDFHQSLGTLATNATTIWSVGLGYRF